MMGRTKPSSKIVMKPIKRIFLVALFITLMLLNIGGNVAAQQDAKPHVLILNSYHQGFSWTNRVIAGISEVFAEAESNAEFHIEYMDTKRLYNEEYLQNLFQLLDDKYDEIPVDLIILSDNNALEFMRDYSEELFPGVPIVFTGINNYNDALLDGFEQITGVAESTDISSTLSLMLKLHPETERIYVINDQTPTGIATLEQFQQIAPDFEDQVEFTVYDDFEIYAMRSELGSLPSNSLILMLLVNRDNTGQFFSYEESLDILSRHTIVPIYGVWDFYIEYGIVGGKLTDGLSQGREAGNMALQILNGVPAADIQVLKESPNQYMFDYEQLERFEIDQALLPEDSLIVNRQPTFFELYRTQIWTIAGIMFGLIIIIIVLLINMRLRRRAEEELAKSFDRRGRQVELSTQITQQIVHINDLDYLYQRIVKDVKELFGYYHSQILQYDPEIDAVRLIAGYGEIGQKMLAQSHQMQMGQGIVGHAAATGETILRPVLEDDPNWQPNPLLPRTKGEIAVPIKLGDEIFGVLDVQSDMPDALSAEDQILLEGLCGQIAVAIEYLRANEETRISEARIRSIVDSALDGVVTIDMNGAIIGWNSRAEKMFGWLEDEAVGKDLADVIVPAEHREGHRRGMQRYRESGKGRVVNRQIEITAQHKDGHQFPIELALFSVQFENTVNFSAFIRDITERQKLMRATEQQAERLALLNTMSNALNKADSLENVYRLVGQYTKEIVGGERASLAIIDSGHESFEILGISGIDGVIPMGAKLPIEGTAVGLCIQQEKIMQFPQDGELAHFPDTRKLADEGIKSTLAAPLFVGGKVFGTLNMGSLSKYYESADVSIIQQVANVLSSTLEIREFLAAAEKQAEELQTVAEVSTTVAATLEQQQLLQNVVDLTKERFGLYHAHIYLMNETNTELALTAGAGEVGRQMTDEGRTIPVDREKSLVARAARLRRGVIVNDVHADPGFLAHPLLPNTCSEMAVPMISGDHLFGVLDVQASEVNHFTSDDVQIQTTLAAQTAVALQNARTIEQAEEANAQLNLLTRRLTREGWDELLKNKSSEKEVGFGYDLKKVVPISKKNGHHIDAKSQLYQPILVQGAEVGTINVADPNALSNEAQEIIMAVSDRLAAHIENLRLTEQTQSALANTEALFAGSESVVRAASMSEILEALVLGTGMQRLDLASLVFFEKPWHQNPETFIVAANWASRTDVPQQPIGTVSLVSDFPVINYIDKGDYFIVEDIDNDPRMDENAVKLFQSLGIKSYFATPLMVGNQIFGFITGNSHQHVSFEDAELRYIKSLVGQAAVVAQSLRLFEDAQGRARREQMLREVTARIHAAPDAESILRVAAQEVNRAIGLESFVYLEASELEKSTNGHDEKK